MFYLGFAPLDGIITRAMLLCLLCYIHTKGTILPATLLCHPNSSVMQSRHTWPIYHRHGFAFRGILVFLKIPFLIQFLPNLG